MGQTIGIFCGTNMGESDENKNQELLAKRETLMDEKKLIRDIDKVALIAVRDTKILMSKSFGKDKWYIPGGKREKNESDKECLKRECKEELSLDLIDSSIVYLGTFRAQADGKKKGTFVKMTCYQAEYVTKPQAANEIEDVRWLSYYDIDIVAEVDKIIFQHLKNEGLLN